MIPTLGAVALLVGAPAAAPPLVRIESADLVVEFLEDPESHGLCGGLGVLSFELHAAARIALAIDGETAEASLDGGRPIPLTALPLAAGSHEVTVVRPPWPGAPAVALSYQLEARTEGGAAVVQTVSGRVVADVANRAVFPVGHTFVTGVDLLDGHVGRQVTDVRIAGRHIGLEATRTYASTARGIRGAVGAGWAFSYARALVSRPSCGLYAVQVADGSAQTFRTIDGGRTFTPERGYHTTLGGRLDGSFDFVDKAAVRQHFARTADRWGYHRLEFVEEPNGDRLELRYDAGGRLAEVAEVLNEGRGVRTIPRTLRLEHVVAGGFGRIARIEASGLGLRVEYEYDAHGNLVGVKRWDEERPAPEAETYRYSIADPRDRHQMVAALLADGSRTTYRYFSPGERLKGENAAGTTSVLTFGKEECVSQVVDSPAKGAAETTIFVYDHSEAAEGLFRITVGATRYLLNRDGNPLEIDEPAFLSRKVSRMVWDPSHKVKIRESSTQGYEGAFAYDERGNHVSAAEVTEHRGRRRVVTYSYHPRFNLLVYRKDATGRVSTWDLDPRTGNLVRADDESGKVLYRYDRQGRLVEMVDAKGHRTRYSGHNSFGYYTRIEAPEGVVKVLEYDLRGRQR